MGDGAPAIAALNWSAIPEDLAARRGARPGRIFAVWPSPAPPHSRLREAGFEEFAEPGEGWAREHRAMTAILLAHLGGFGAPRLAASPRRYWRTLLGFEVPRRALVEETFRAAVTEGTACRVEFGRPPRARLQTDGHGIWWIALESGDEEAVLRAVRAMAGVRSVRRRDLAWEGFVS